MPEYRLKAFFNDGRVIVDTPKTLHVWGHNALFNKDYDIFYLCQDLVRTILEEDVIMANIQDDLVGTVLGSDLDTDQMLNDVLLLGGSDDLDIFKKIEDIKGNG